MRDNHSLDSGGEDRLFQSNGALIPHPGAEVLSAYDALYGTGVKTPDATRVV